MVGPVTLVRIWASLVIAHTDDRELLPGDLVLYLVRDDDGPSAVGVFSFYVADEDQTPRWVDPVKH
jgi:hypothetical protein